jgi:hypothetical protein
LLIDPRTESTVWGSVFLIRHWGATDCHMCYWLYNVHISIVWWHKTWIQWGIKSHEEQFNYD